REGTRVRGGVRTAVSGALATKVCGTHLKRGYRLAFTLKSSRAARSDGIVEVLYVGPRDTRDRTRDVWTIVHDLFRETNPTEGHLRPPCCGSSLPTVDEE